MGKLYQLLIRASDKIVAINLKTRAEMLSSVVLCKTAADATVLFLFIISHHPDVLSLVIALMISTVSYGFSRSKYFEIGAVVIIAEPIIHIPWILTVTGPLLSGSVAAPIWLGCGALISSLILPLRLTFLVIAATCCSFFIIFLNTPETYRQVLFVEFLFILAIAFLALIGSYMRDRSDRILRQEHAKLVQASKLSSLGEMASGIAHELNSPLAAISLSAELAEELLAGDSFASKDEVNSNLLLVRETAARMSQIIGGLKAFARDASHDQPACLNSKTWITDSLSLCELKFKKAAINLIIDEDSFTSVCTVRRVQLSQALLNLLYNSFDAVEKQHERWVKVSGSITDGNFELAVTDSGNGISEDIAENIFNPFYTTKDFGSTGLGLSIAKGILQSHGGDLIFDQKFQKTRFVLRLPLALENLSNLENDGSAA